MGRKAQSRGSAQLSKLHWEFIIPSYSSGSIHSLTRSGADSKDSVKYTTEGRLLEAPLDCYTFLGSSSSSRYPKAFPEHPPPYLKQELRIARGGHVEMSHIPNPTATPKLFQENTSTPSNHTTLQMKTRT